jgi:aryl-alcohol dehydrogenase-like predicted oxidoreductase
MLERLIFGTGVLHRLATSSARQRVLGAVVDAGVRGFDAAPAYGNGVDEVELGDALRRVSGELAINTKFGIPVPEYGAWARYAFPLRRLADKLSGRSAAAYRRREFSREAMEGSVERSLRRLAPHPIDVLFVHEPRLPLDARSVDDILETGARLKAQGKIRRLGVAGPASSLALCANLAAFDVVQTRCLDALPAQELAPGKPMVLYSTFEAYRSEDRRETFAQFLRELLASRPGSHAIVATRSTERAASLRELAA